MTVRGEFRSFETVCAWPVGETDIKMTVMEWIRRVSSTKYTRLLEADVALLRAENRALLNSILGIAGVPPVMVADNDVSPAAGLKPSVSSAGATTNGVRTTGPKRSGGSRNGPGTGAELKPAPMRRRSWQQIYRMLEINSARKKEAGEII
jgi:hypothetical protein